MASFQLSDFQKSKITGVFNTLYAGDDIDNNPRVTREDGLSVPSEINVVRPEPWRGTFIIISRGKDNSSFLVTNTNKDGVIEKADFEEAINKICTIHCWPKGGEKYKEAQETLAMIWEGLKGVADENKAYALNYLIRGKVPQNNDNKIEVMKLGFSVYELHSSYSGNVLSATTIVIHHLEDHLETRDQEDYCPEFDRVTILKLDDKVTEDEWLQMWATCVRDVSSGHGFPLWQKKYMEFMFKVNDTSEDNYIDKTEYTTLYTKFGVDKDECEAAFDRLAVGTDGRISKADFENLWREYFVSDDRSSRGNFLFGRSPC